MKLLSLNLIIYCLLSIGQKAFADSVYIVQPQDTLTDILEENDLEPIYGDNGNLEKLYKLNPKLKKVSISVGMKLILPDREDGLPAIDPDTTIQEKISNPQQVPVASVATAPESVTPVVKAPVTVAPVEPAPVVAAVPEPVIAETVPALAADSIYQNFNHDYQVSLNEDFKSNLKEFSLIESLKNLEDLQLPQNKVATEFNFEKLEMSNLGIRVIRRVLLSLYPKEINVVPELAETKAELKPEPKAEAVAIVAPVAPPVEAQVPQIIEAATPTVPTLASDSIYLNYNYDFQVALSDEFKNNLKGFSLLESQKNLGDLKLSQDSVKTEFNFDKLEMNDLGTRVIRRVLLSQYPKEVITVSQPDTVKPEIAPVVTQAPVANVAAPRKPAQEEIVMPEKRIELEAIPIVAELPESRTITPPKKTYSNPNQFVSFTLSPRVSWKNITSIDDNAYHKALINALTEMNYGMDFDYALVMSKKVRAYTHLKFEQVSFIADESIHLSGNKFNAMNLEAGVFLDNKWDIKFGMVDQFYLFSPTRDYVGIKKVKLPKIEIGMLNTLFVYEDAHIDFNLASELIAPRTSPGIAGKLGFGGKIEATAALRNQSFKIGYENLQLKATNNDTVAEDIYWLFNWNFR